jgi:hypothetical protein
MVSLLQVSPSDLCRYLLIPYLHHIRRPTYLYCFYSSNNIWRRVNIMKVPETQFFYPSPTSCHLAPNIFLSSLFSKSLALFSLLNARDQASFPLKQQAQTGMRALKSKSYLLQV